jgi:2-polyprenyl-6-hydroxyphenyl methylase/3-demethylubiquinone-9 3-methyltransferase
MEPGRVVLVPRDARSAAREAAELGLADAWILPPSRWSPLRRRYRSASVGVVAEPSAWPAAALARRLSRVPWVASLDEPLLARLPDRAARALSDAAAVVAPPGAAETVERLAGGVRLVERGDAARLRAVLTDVGLAPDARGKHRPVLGALADMWTFAGDRATRLAIRLMPLTGRSREPIHPKHLIADPGHHWYLEHLRAADAVLDAGCGNGVHSVAAAALARSVVGVDVDAGAVALARRRADELGIANVAFRIGDLSDGAGLDGLADDTFDAVLALDVLEHFADRRAFLRSLRRLLRSDGRLLVAVPNATTPYRRGLRRLGGFAYADADHKIEYTQAGLEGELADAGFRVAELERAVHDTPFAGLGSLVAVVSLRAYAALEARRARRVRGRPASAMAFRVVAVPADSPGGTDR